MPSRPRGLVYAAAALGALAMTNAATAAPHAVTASAPTGTLKGHVAAGLRPSAGAITTVRAIDASNLTVVKTGSLSKAGAYTLKVPAGVYLLAVDKLEARARPASGYSRLVRVHPGRKISLPTVTRRPQHSLRRGLYQGKPAIAVKGLTGSGPYPFLGRGVANMLMTDLAASPCLVLIEWMRRAEVLAELRLQQSKYVDPSTRVTPRLVQPDIFIEGSVATTESSVTISVRIREIRSGRIIGSARASGPNVFDLEEEIARKLLEMLEAECIPERFEGTFTGENRTAGTNTYSGTITFVRNTTSPAGTVTYRVERVQWRHRFTAETPCVVNASTSVTVARPDPRLSVLVIQKGRTAKGYGYAITAFFTSPRQLTITATCNGVVTTQPWVPGAALNTGPPGTGLTGTGTFTDGKTIKGTYESTGTASTYTWNLKGAG